MTQVWDRSHSNELRTWLGGVGRDHSAGICHEGSWAWLSAVSQSSLTSFFFVCWIPYSTPVGPLCDQPCILSEELFVRSEQTDCCRLFCRSAVEGVAMGTPAEAMK